MGVANIKSTIVTKLDAVPRGSVPLALAGARLREQVATVEVAAADDNNSVYRFFRVHSSWRVSALLLLNDAIASGTAFDIGVYETAENGGAVVDADLYGSDVSMASARAATGPVDLTYEALNVDQIEKSLWQLLATALGVTADPKREFDICLTADTVGTAAGTISMRLQYVDNT
jgi:hypothetical protein